MTSFLAATRRLQRRLGADVVSTEAAARQRVSFDSSRIAFPLEAVIFPRSEEDLGIVLQHANRHRVPVTVRGRGTTLTGAAAPARGGWVVDMLAWNRLHLDAESGILRAQAGATVAAIQRRAESRGWFYPPDPSSKEYCTIGGNIACNAGGMHGGKYGVTRDFVLALRGLLPTGEIVQWGTPTRKFSAGFNLRDLWIGSEGMLGIVTEATLRLIPLPAARWTLLLTFTEEADAFRAVRRLFAAKIQPAICEFLDRYAVLCAERAMGLSLFPGQEGRPVVLIELAGSAGEVREQKRAVLAWARTEARAWRAARDRADAERLWAVRRQCSGAMFELGDSKLNEDIVVPARQYERFGRFLERLRKESQLAIPTFGHLGDGNLHVNIMYHRDNPRESAAAVKAVEKLMKTVVALGGAISGEHGIGLAKSPFLTLQHSPAQIRAMRAVKDALDPQGILNPGKMFEAFEVWKHPRVAARFPWDHK